MGSTLVRASRAVETGVLAKLRPDHRSGRVVASAVSEAAAAAVGWSRTATGRHFPTDVAVGAVVGVAVGGAVHALSRRVERAPAPSDAGRGRADTEPGSAMGPRPATG